MIDVITGRVAYAVLSFGGILGFGAKLFAMPWSALTVDEPKQRFIANVTREALEKMPGFDKDRTGRTSATSTTRTASIASGVLRRTGREPCYDSAREPTRLSRVRHPRRRRSRSRRSHGPRARHGDRREGRRSKTVVVGRDCRLTSPRLFATLTDGIRVHAEVIDIGVVPTPVLYFASHHLKPAAAVMITGSHNPPEDNGFKIMIGTAARSTARRSPSSAIASPRCSRSKRRIRSSRCTRAT